MVVSDSSHIVGIKFPDNVDLYLDIPYSKYIDLLRCSSIVAIPLKKLSKSTGQVVFLEAMALGKPVIATETTGTVDYIVNGDNGRLVPPGSSIALRGAILEYLNDSEPFRLMAKRALEQIVEFHSFDSYAKSILAKAQVLMATDY